MFGTYRTFLALAVVIHHLISIPVIGHYAVHGFFILSGYLMTYIMINSYGYSLQGIRSFAINRFLRLYPSYWFVLIITLVAILVFGENNSSGYRDFIYFPDSFLSTFQNISLLYFDIFPGTVSPRLSPPTWALTIEILFYLLIALGISRSKKITTLWFMASLAYMASSHILNLGYGYRYGIVIAGTLPFSVGAMIFHYYQNPRLSFIKNLQPHIVFVLFFVFVLNSRFADICERIGFTEPAISVFFYANYIINSIIIIMLIDCKLPLISKDLDNKIGNFSYPIYLIHWQAGFIATMIIWGEPVRGLNVQGLASLVLALVICVLTSLLIVRYIDLPIERLRRKVKQIANKQLNSDAKTDASAPVS